MSITDELRDCIRTANKSYEDARNPYNDREILHIPEEELLAIADRIDAEHEKAVTAAHSNGITKYGSMVAREYVKLPVDADGVPIHVGDELTNGIDLPAKVRGMSLDEDGWLVSSASFRVGRRVDPSTLRHTRPDTWERIIEDAANLVRGDNESVVELVERCRRLAGGA